MEVLNKLKESQTKLYSELSKVIVGQNEIIEHMFIALLCRGHVLLEGVPGLAKTLLIQCLSNGLDLKFNRIWFCVDGIRFAYHKTKAVPKAGCPAKGISFSGVKILTSKSTSG